MQAKLKEAVMAVYRDSKLIAFAMQRIAAGNTSLS